MIGSEMLPEMEEKNTEDTKALDLNTYRTFLKRISGVSILDDNEIVDMGHESASSTDNEMEQEEQTFVTNSVLSYQCFKKAVNPDNLDSGLKGFTPDDIFEPTEVITMATIEATCPEFTRFSFTFNPYTEAENEDYQMMKKALYVFDNARMDINEIDINEYIPFFFCELISTAEDGEVTICRFCNPLLIRTQIDSIDLIVPTALVSFVVE